MTNLKIGNILLKNNLILAPMAGVTDRVFRSLCSEYGAALTFTEMVSAKGLFYQSKNSQILLTPSKDSSVMGAQLFGKDPALLAAQAASEPLAPYDIIDINMGCPARKITANGEGSALLKEPQLVFDILSAVVNAVKKPVTVKIRAGWDKSSINAPEIARLAEKAGVAAVTVHGRTTDQGYSGKADYGIIREVRQAVSVPVIGNGDVSSGPDAQRLLEETGCDGIMIGRGATGRPWIFAEVLSYLSGCSYTPPSWQERLDIAARHGRELATDKGEKVAMLQMRKHLFWYIGGRRYAASLRESMNKISTLEDFYGILALLRELE